MISLFSSLRSLFIPFPPILTPSTASLVTITLYAYLLKGNTMQLGMIGLGKMGANMSVRLMQGGHEIVAGDLNPLALQAIAEAGATPATDMADLVSRLAAPRAVWVMI